MSSSEPFHCVQSKLKSIVKSLLIFELEEETTTEQRSIYNNIWIDGCMHSIRKHSDVWIHMEISSASNNNNNIANEILSTENWSHNEPRIIHKC